MFGFHRIRRAKGWAIESRKGRIYVGFAGKIYRMHIELGTFNISWERPYREG